MGTTPATPMGIVSFCVCACAASSPASPTRPSCASSCAAVSPFAARHPPSPHPPLHLSLHHLHVGASAGAVDVFLDGVLPPHPRPLFHVTSSCASCLAPPPRRPLVPSSEPFSPALRPLLIPRLLSFHASSPRHCPRPSRHPL
ncbi:hypothetical protein M758_12G061800 [Ceratodon purpureus]|nr:hypothetical protein M758_12G061800 [Ceratodon purpureus]